MMTAGVICTGMRLLLRRWRHERPPGCTVHQYLIEGPCSRFVISGRFISIHVHFYDILSSVCRGLENAIVFIYLCNGFSCNAIKIFADELITRTHFSFSHFHSSPKPLHLTFFRGVQMHDATHVTRESNFFFPRTECLLFLITFPFQEISKCFPL